MELCLRLTNGNTVLAPLLAAGATERQFDTGGSQRRVA
jgi:hypothetical protein